MSYDIRIWSIQPALFPEFLPVIGDYVQEGNFITYAHKNWQIIISYSAKVEEENVADEVMVLLPGVKYVTDITLEPIHAPGAAVNMLKKLTEHIAGLTTGVIENPQERTYTLPSGVKKFIPPQRENKARFSILEMSWWFTEHPEIPVLSKKLIEYFERKLPEALPRRYGPYEPLAFKYVETGKEKFLQFFNENVFQYIVWRPNRPVMSVYVSLEEEWGFRRNGNKDKFKTNHFSISFDASILDQPGWPEHLLSIFKDLSAILQPFYGEARILHNFIFGKSTYLVDGKTDQHPVKGSWWAGVPQELGQAIVIGEPYSALWERIRQKGESTHGLYFLSTPDWRNEQRVNSIVGEVPREIAEVKKSQKLTFLSFLGTATTMDYSEEYPKVFPFSKRVLK